MAFLEKWIRSMGMVSAWLNPLLVFLICADVMIRYFFQHTFNWLLELEWHMFGMIFLLGSAYTLQADKHVRVDVFYNNYSVRKKLVSDTILTIILLIPWCLVGIRTCLSYASNSFYIMEGSPNPGGLPYWFVIKYLIVFCFVLLLAQAVLIVVKNIKSLMT